MKNEFDDHDARLRAACATATRRRAKAWRPRRSGRCGSAERRRGWSKARVAPRRRPIDGQMDEERLTAVETQSRVTAEAVMAIAGAVQNAAPAILELQDQLDTYRAPEE